MAKSVDEILEEVKKAIEGHYIREIYKVELVTGKAWFNRCCGQRMSRVKVYIVRPMACGIPEHTTLIREDDRYVCLCCGSNYIKAISFGPP